MQRRLLPAQSFTRQRLENVLEKLLTGKTDLSKHCSVPHIHHKRLILSRLESGKVWNESDFADHTFLNNQPYPRAWTYSHNHEHEVRPRRNIFIGPEYPPDEDYIEENYRGEMSFEIIFRSHTNGRIHPGEAHSIVKRFVPVGALITIVG